MGIFFYCLQILESDLKSTLNPFLFMLYFISFITWWIISFSLRHQMKDLRGIINGRCCFLPRLFPRCICHPVDVSERATTWRPFILLFDPDERRECNMRPLSLLKAKNPWQLKKWREIKENNKLFDIALSYSTVIFFGKLVKLNLIYKKKTRK